MSLRFSLYICIYFCSSQMFLFFSSASNSGRLVPTAEVMSLPVINEEHKSLSFNYAASTPVSKSSPDAFHPSSPDLDFLETWLRNSGLLGYRDNFLQCACYSKEQILRLKVK